MTQPMCLTHKHNTTILLMAHELKTPVTTLKLLIQSHLNKHRIFSDSLINCDDLSTVSRELDRLARLIDDYLAGGRVGSSGLEPRYKALELVDFIEGAVRDMKINFKDRDISFEKVLKSSFVFADPDRIKQVLINLVSNAAKYTGTDGKIVISLTQQKKEVIVSVKDRGMGIPKKKQRYIFNKFYQASKKGGSGGRGLGLYISKQIIDQHNGRFWFRSTEGKGSTFCFSLPVMEASLE